MRLQLSTSYLENQIGHGTVSIRDMRFNCVFIFFIHSTYLSCVAQWSEICEKSKWQE